MIDGLNFFDQPIRNNLITYDNIRKIATSQGNNYITACLRDYNYFKNYYKMIGIDFSKQEALDADPKAIQQINFIGNLEEQSTIFFIIEEGKETVLDFLQGTVKYSNLIFFFNIKKMAKYNALNVKLFNLQLNKLKSAIKNEPEVILNL